jgi:hypothetical protein
VLEGLSKQASNYEEVEKQLAAAEEQKRDLEARNEVRRREHEDSVRAKDEEIADAEK